MHIFEWYDFLAIYFLSVLSLIGLIFGSRLIFNSGAKMLSDLSVKWLGFLMCAAVFILISFACWLVTMMILYGAVSANFNVLPDVWNTEDNVNATRAHITCAQPRLQSLAQCVTINAVHNTRPLT